MRDLGQIALALSRMKEEALVFVDEMLGMVAEIAKASHGAGHLRVESNSNIIAAIFDVIRPLIPAIANDELTPAQLAEARRSIDQIGNRVRPRMLIEKRKSAFQAVGFWGRPDLNSIADLLASEGHSPATILAMSDAGVLEIPGIGEAQLDLIREVLKG